MKMSIDKTRVLVYDIETTPLQSYTWGTYQTDVIKVQQDWYMLSFAYKWLGDKKTKVYGLPDFATFKKDKTDDSELVKKLHELFDEADIVIAHNGDRFDQKKSQARFLLNDLPPPSPYLQIDTLKVAKKYFKLTSNRLNDLGDYLKVGKKVETGGFDLWLKCMAGDTKAWKLMKKYNKQDVDLLELVYLKLRPWMTNHPNMANIEGRPESCPICGKEGFMWAQGVRYTKTGQYRRFQCKDCGAYSSMRNQEKGERPNFV